MSDTASQYNPAHVEIVNLQRLELVNNARFPLHGLEFQRFPRTKRESDFRDADQSGGQLARDAINMLHCCCPSIYSLVARLKSVRRRNDNRDIGIPTPMNLEDQQKAHAIHRSRCATAQRQQCEAAQTPENMRRNI